MRPSDRQYKREKHILSKFCQAQGLHYSDKREAVLEVFLGTERHVTTVDLRASLEKRGVIMDPKTVHAALQLLVEAGLASELRLEDGSIVYEHAFAHKHHDHLICRKCGRMIEFASPVIEKLQEEIAALHHFVIEDHTFSLYGVCGACAGKERVKPPPPLSHTERVLLTSLDKLKPGQHGTVRVITGGESVCKRLAAMGIRPGKAITKVSAMLMRGPVVVSIDRRQLAIGHGMACKVMLDTSS